jgi:hypothetical protein
LYKNFSCFVILLKSCAVGVALSELNLFVSNGADAGCAANSVFSLSFSAFNSSIENSTTSVVLIDFGVVPLSSTSSANSSTSSSTSFSSPFKSAIASSRFLTLSTNLSKASSSNF